MRRRHEQPAFPGSVHFVTIVTLERGDWFCSNEQCTSILQWFEGYRAKYELVCAGYVLMPDHLHALLIQTNEDNPVSLAIAGFKRMTSLRSKPSSYSRHFNLWRPTYDDVSVPGSHAAHTKLRYMHANPVKRGLCEAPENWPWSSAQFYFDDTSGIVNVEPLSHEHR
jgi:putative transposase